MQQNDKYSGLSWMTEELKSQLILRDKIVLVPEAATMLFTGGFPRSNDIEVVKYVQRAIFHVQKNLEEL